MRVLDNFSSGKLENLSSVDSSSFELLKGDIRDSATCLNACEGVDYVLHQAALRSVPKSLQDPQAYNDVNINGTLCLLKAAVKNKVKRFVFASSSSVYGDSESFPQKESDLPLLISPYALTKLAGEYYCRIFSQHFGLETVSLRYFNVFGPRQALDDEYAVVIPKFIQSIQKGIALPIFGSGKQSRDFTFVENVVLANILAATIPGIKEEIFNVAGGMEHTVLELVEVLNRIMGKNVSPEFLPIRPGDVFRTCADISRIKSKLGYVLKVDFEEGLRKTVEWFKNPA